MGSCTNTQIRVKYTDIFLHTYAKQSLVYALSIPVGLNDIPMIWSDLKTTTKSRHFLTLANHKMSYKVRMPVTPDC